MTLGFPSVTFLVNLSYSLDLLISFSSIEALLYSGVSALSSSASGVYGASKLPSVPDADAIFSSSDKFMPYLSFASGVPLSDFLKAELIATSLFTDDIFLCMDKYADCELLAKVFIFIS